MAFSVQMPALGESVTEGTVTRWLKQEGEPVEVDEPLLEVSTDKVDTEIPSPAAGVLQRIVVAEDETVEVGAELAVIGDGAAQQPAEEPPAAQPQPEPEPAPEAEVAEPSPGGGSPAGVGGTPVRMPALGESVTEGTVVRWLKQVGDSVAVDEPLLEVSTDKVDTEIPSPVAGTLLQVSVREDETVEVGGHLAVVGTDEPAAGSRQAEPAPRPEPDEPAEAPLAEEADRHAEAEQQSAETTAPTTSPGRRAPQDGPRKAAEGSAGKAAHAETPDEVPGPATPAVAPGPPEPARAAPESDGAPYVTPLVRKLAAERGVDLSTVRGSGVGGRIRKQDVVAAAERAAEAAQKPEPPAQPAPQPAATEAGLEAPPRAAAPAAGDQRGTTEKMSRLRAVIAQRMVESLRVSAQLTSVVEADLSRIALLRERAKRDFEAREGVRLSFLPFFARAAVEALKQHPKVNASLDADSKEITYHDAEHLGIAVDTDRGLLVPVIHDAGDLNIAGLARKITDLAERTRSSKVTPDELGGGTFTLSNTGSRGALFDTPIINQPQVGILAAGAVVKRAVVVSDDLGRDTLAIRSMAYLALSYDHRLVDGADAARFLTTVKQRLEAGAFEADLGL